MADLSGRTREGTGRGQLILVGAITIAALLLTLALLLNGAIYTESVATRGGHADAASAAVDHRIAAERAVSGLLNRSNAEGWTYDEFRDNVSSWNGFAGRQAASGGVSTTIEVTGTPATRIVHDDATRNFTNAAASERWTLLDGVSGVERWELNVSRASLVDPVKTTNASEFVTAGAFTVEFAGSSETWRLFLYQDGVDTVSVAVDDGTDPVETCSATEDPSGAVTVNVTAATVGGADCAALASLVSFLEGTTHTVTYDAAASATGTYTLLVERPVETVEDGDFATDGGSPYVLGQVRDVTMDVRYTAGGMRFHDANVVISEVRP